MMNERIKELAEQAGFSMWSNESWKPQGAVIDWSCNYDHELEKFARLIVEKCAAEAALMGISNYDSDDIAWTSATIADNIKKRFGLE